MSAGAGVRRSPSWLTSFVVVALLIGARNPVALLRAEFWAEDASQFFVGALTMGARSLWVPVWGYWFLISRSIAWAATWFDVLWTPYIYAGASLVVDAVAISYFVRDGFEWLVPGRARRLLVCAVLGVGPGTSEVFLNLSNLPGPLTLLCVLLLLEEPLRLDGRRLLLFLVLVPSAGHTVLLAPLVVGIWWLTRDRRYLILLALLLAVAAGNFVGSEKAASNAGILGYGNAGSIPRILVENALLRFLVGPFLGPTATGRFMTWPAVAFWPLLLAAGAVFLLALKRAAPHPRRVVLLGLAYLSAVGLFGLVALTRSYAILQIQRESGAALWSLRYSFLPGAIALLIWFSICFSYREHPRWRFAAWAAIAVLSLQNLARWNDVYDRPDLRWPEKAAGIQRLLDLKSRGELKRPRVRVVPAHPREWRGGRPVTVTISP